MRATVMYSAGDVRIETVPDARLVEPTDAVVRVTRAAICGSDLWPYKSMPPSTTGRRMGHEFIGIVEEVGSRCSDLAGRPAGDRPTSYLGRDVRLLPRGPSDLLRARRQVRLGGRGRRPG